MLTLLLACTGAPPPAPPPPPPPRASLVVVTLDTTRADRLGAYGYTKANTPLLDSLAAQGVRFDRAYATVPLTTASHSSMFTGLYPPRHGVHSNGDAVLPESVDTLAEQLQAEGYRTGASVAAFVTTRVWNLDQGFDAYFDQVRGGGDRWHRERPAHEVVDDAIAWLEQGDSEEPFLLWVHLFDPHAPYTVAPAFRESMGDRPYDAELAAVDAALSRLAPVAERAAGSGGLAWIAMGDHGEALENEHGEVSHGLFHYDATARVPFLVKPAEPLKEPVVAPGAVSGADLMPTALGLLDLPVPEGLDGVDLSGWARGAPVQRGPVYMESYTVQQRLGYHPELAMAEGDLKLMATPNPRLFDLAADPGEATNVLEQHPEQVARLREALAAVEAETVEAQALSMSPELAAQLEALGYMGGAAPTQERSDIDAKDRLEVLRELELARAMASHPLKGKETEQTFRAILRSNPQLSEAQMGLARALRKQGRPAEAIVVYEAALATNPDSAVVRANLANTLGMMGESERALAEFERVLLQVPNDDVARTGVLRLMADLGRDGEAMELARSWLVDSPDDPGLKAQLGILMGMRGDLEDAEPLLMASLQDQVPRQLVHRMLADQALIRGDAKTAARLLRSELDRFPGDSSSRMLLANLYMTSERWDDAAAEYGAILEWTPEHPDAHLMRAQAIFNTGDYPLADQILAAALERDPSDPDAVLLKANLLAKFGDREGGEALFKEAQELKRQRLEEEAAQLPGG